MKYIKLRGKNNLETAVSDCDYLKLNKYAWHLSGDGYVSRKYTQNKKHFTIYMHREIKNPKNIKGLMVDHIDHDKLNNQRGNLRVATNSQNQMNRSAVRGKSIYKGVSWNTKKQKWKTVLKKDNIDHYIGYFDSEVQAAIAYDLNVHSLFGKYAKANFSGAEIMG